jgi:hypothetical protein
MYSCKVLRDMLRKSNWYSCKVLRARVGDGRADGPKEALQERARRTAEARGEWLEMVVHNWLELEISFFSVFHPQEEKRKELGDWRPPRIGDLGLPAHLCLAFFAINCTFCALWFEPEIILGVHILK